MKRCHGDAFVPVGVEFELCLGVVAVLDERHLIGRKGGGRWSGTSVWVSSTLVLIQAAAVMFMIPL